MHAAATIGNPWITIWTSPRATIRRIVDLDPHYKVVLLAAVSGALTGLERRWSQVPSATTPGAGIWPLVVVWSVVGGAIVGVIGLYLNGVLLKWSGAFLGGVASYAQVRAALAWSEVPAITALAIGIVAIAAGMGAPTMFTGESAAGSSTALSLLHAALGAWSFVLTLHCLSEVHRFSAWRALGSVLILVAAFAILALVVLAILLGGGRMMHPMTA